MKRPRKCPVCRREAPWEGNRWRPFCSERCRLTDLGNWVSERYRIPDSSPAPRDEDETEEDA